MALSGINLTLNREQQWLNKVIISLSIFITCIITSIIALCFIFKTNQYLTIEKNNLNEQLNQINHKQSLLAQQLNMLKQNQITLQTPLTGKQIATFIKLLNTFPIQGSIESIIMKSQMSAEINLNGLLTPQNDFNQVENFLKESNLKFKINDFQINDKQQTEFDITIYLEE